MSDLQPSVDDFQIDLEIMPLYNHGACRLIYCCNEEWAMRGLGGQATGCEGWNAQSSHLVWSLHFEQTSPGLISAMVLAVTSMSDSMVLVMGLPLNQASLLSVQLPL